MDILCLQDKGYHHDDCCRDDEEQRFGNFFEDDSAKMGKPDMTDHQSRGD